MNNLPIRRLSNPPSNNHHTIRVGPPNRFMNSLNRMDASSSRTSIFDPLLSRFPRRIRLFSLVVILLIGSFCWFRRTSPSSHSWNHPFSSPKSTESVQQTVPTVSRDVLNRLEQLTQSQFEDEERAIEELIYSDLIRSNQTFHPGLPFLTSLPPDRRVSFSNLNQKYQQSCPDNLPYPCGFLVAGYVGEQETKAQIHLHQLGLLALALNRTLVLPQLSQSRMGSCLKYPFDFYYQTNALNRLGVRTLSHEKFLDWFTHSNSKIPSARLLAIVNRQQVPYTPSQGSVSFDQPSTSNQRLHFQPDRQFCLRNNTLNSKLQSKILFNFDAFLPLTIVAPEGWHRSVQNREKFSETIIQSIRDSDSLSSDSIGSNKATGRSPTSQSSVGRPDILVVNYELRYPFLDPTSKHSQALIGSDGVGKDQDQVELKLEKFQHFPYAPFWDEVVQALVNRLPPMIGVHWRQENIRTADLKNCAQSLITTLESIKKNYPSLQRIYLSTDYPIEQVHPPYIDPDHHHQQQQLPSLAKAHSGTFSKLITQEHHQIMQQLIGNKFSSSLSWLTFNSLIENLDLPLELVHKLILLPGLQDIKELDRMMKITKLDQKGEFKNIKNQNEIKKLIKEFFKLKIQTEEVSKEGGELEEETDDKNNDNKKTIDMGIIGILEKLILIKSNFFLTGVPNQCSKSSSFTNHVIQNRQLFIDNHFAKFGYLLDLDFFHSSSKSNHNFNLVEFWS